MNPYKYKSRIAIHAVVDPFKLLIINSCPMLWGLLSHVLLLVAGSVYWTADL